MAAPGTWSCPFLQRKREQKGLVGFVLQAVALPTSTESEIGDFIMSLAVEPRCQGQVQWLFLFVLLFAKDFLSISMQSRC